MSKRVYRIMQTWRGYYIERGYEGDDGVLRDVETWAEVEIGLTAVSVPIPESARWATPQRMYMSGLVPRHYITEGHARTIAASEKMIEETMLDVTAERAARDLEPPVQIARL